MKDKLLIVDDKEDNLAVAEDALTGRKELLFAKDYNTAVELAGQFQDQIYGAIIDCFFPKKTGSHHTYLGKEVIDEVCSSMDNNGSRNTLSYREALSRAKRDLYEIGFRKRHPALEDKLTDLVLMNKEINEVTKKSLARSVKFVGEIGANNIASSALGMLMGSSAEERRMTYHEAMLNALNKNNSIQPLGVELAKDLSEYSLPFVMLTSEKHHGELCEPVEQYFNRNKWEIVTGAEKNKLGTWREAYGRLGRD